MAESTVPAFRRGLRDRLAADTSLVASGAQFKTGDPYPARPQQRLVMIMGTIVEEPPSLMGGPGLYVKYETYETEVFCSTIKHNRDDQLTLEEDAWNLSEIVCSSIRAWALPANGPWGGITLPTGAQVNWIVVTGRRLEQPIGDDDREARVTITIQTKATV